MILFLYRFFAPAVVALFRFGVSSVWLFRPLLGHKLFPRLEKVRSMLKAREVSVDRLINDAFDRGILNRSRPVILIHASSGEFEYAKPLIRALSGRTQIAVSYFSPSYESSIRNTAGVTFAFPLPFDTVRSMQKMLRALKPTHVLFARTDVWPNLAMSCLKNSISASLFSATFAEDSSRVRSYVSRKLHSSVYRLLKGGVFVVSESDRDVLQRMLQVESDVGGDTRYDQVLHRLNHPAKDVTQLKPFLKTNVFIAGSIWPEDLQPVLEASNQLQSHWPHSLIVVPHEPSSEFCGAIEAYARESKSDLTCTRLSQVTKKSNAPHSGKAVGCLIIDQPGWLADLYPLAQIAFVGGSFRAKVHSVMEPLAAGCVTFVGPHYSNNREAVEFTKIKLRAKLSAVTSVSSSAEFQRRLIDLSPILNDQATVDHFTRAIKDEVHRRSGATQNLIRLLRLS